jgi:hypothetical protein
MHIFATQFSVFRGCRTFHGLFSKKCQSDTFLFKICNQISLLTWFPLTCSALFYRCVQLYDFLFFKESNLFLATLMVFCFFSLITIRHYILQNVIQCMQCVNEFCTCIKFKVNIRHIQVNIIQNHIEKLDLFAIQLGLVIFVQIRSNCIFQSFHNPLFDREIFNVFHLIQIVTMLIQSHRVQHITKLW